jgi:hypothetical protein
MGKRQKPYHDDVVNRDEDTVNMEKTIPARLEQITFDENDLFDQDRMVEKLDRLILAWGQELVYKGYLDHIPESDDAWNRFLEMDIYWGDLHDPWDHYIVGCLIFFVPLRSDIKKSFLLQPDTMRGRRLGRWLPRLKHYMTPLLQDVVTRFIMSYSMIMEIKPIQVRFNTISNNQP